MPWTMKRDLFDYGVGEEDKNARKSISDHGEPGTEKKNKQTRRRKGNCIPNEQMNNNPATGRGGTSDKPSFPSSGRITGN